MPVEPKIAATVVLLREKIPETDDDCEFEVFMAKRHKNTKFMSEHHVFPGGALDDQDLTNESKARLIGIDDHVISNLTDICEDPANLWIIAIRELFEETGILIATNQAGDSLRKIQIHPKKLRKHQRNLQKKRKTMTDVLTKENLYYAAHNLRYFGRLITPKLSPIRFDTQFFICEFPRNQNINLFTDELTECYWGTPKQLLKDFKNNQIKLIFPQYSTLQRLSKFKTIQEVFNNSKNISSRNRLNDFQ
jgi:8-oxo-dGTP pyrophosphatase MutT (NUDIX family)